MEVGPLIKLHRIKQNIKQEDLAKDVVSESYLSKIENNKTNANPKVVRTLCDRLGICVNDEEAKTDIVKLCQKWFDILYEFNNKETMTNMYEQLEDLVSHNITAYNVLFEIHKIRYFVIIGNHHNAFQQITVLKELINNFKDEEMYYWSKFVGEYYEVIRDYNKSLQYYKMAERISRKMDLTESEVADLNYMLSSVHSNLRNSLEVIDYINQALKYYRKYYNLARCARGHVLLGIAYRRLRIFEKAIHNFNLAIDLALISKDEGIKRLIIINLGHLYSAKGEPDQVVYYFEKILEDKDATTQQKLVAISALAKEYFFAHEIEKKKEMVNYGLSILNQIEDKENYRFYYLKLMTYHYAIEEQFDKFESFVMNEFIPYLKKHKDYVNLVTYGKMLGEYFEDLNRYKYASYYYKLVNDAYEKLVQL